MSSWRKIRFIGHAPPRESGPRLAAQLDPWIDQADNGIDQQRPGFIFDPKLKKWVKDMQGTYPEIGPTFPGVTDINKVGGTYPIGYNKCPVCDGNGSYQNEFHHEAECIMCEGSGIVHIPSERFSDSMDKLMEQLSWRKKEGEVVGAAYNWAHWFDDRSDGRYLVTAAICPAHAREKSDLSGFAKIRTHGVKQCHFCGLSKIANEIKVASFSSGSVSGYVYDSDVHCKDCAADRFGDKLDNDEAEDHGGEPPHPMWSFEEWDSPETCGTCMNPFCTTCGSKGGTFKDKEECGECEGTGKVEARRAPTGYGKCDCNGNDSECPSCEGSGIVGQKTCSECKGKGHFKDVYTCGNCSTKSHYDENEGFQYISSKTGGANGSLPDLEYRVHKGPFTPDITADDKMYMKEDLGHSGRGSQGGISAHLPDGTMVGGIGWGYDRVKQVMTHPDYSRRGIATELWGQAKQLRPRLRHSDDLTGQGQSWKRSLAQAFPQQPGDHQADNGIEDPVTDTKKTWLKKIIPDTTKTLPGNNEMNVSIDNMPKTGSKVRPEFLDEGEEAGRCDACGLVDVPVTAPPEYKYKTCNDCSGNDSDCIECEGSGIVNTSSDQLCRRCRYGEPSPYQNLAQCPDCGHEWDPYVEPTPSGRCPNEWNHEYDSNEVTGQAHDPQPDAEDDTEAKEDVQPSDLAMHVVQSHPLMAEELDLIDALDQFSDMELDELHIEDHMAGANDHNPEVLRVAKVAMMYETGYCPECKTIEPTTVDGKCDTCGTELPDSWDTDHFDGKTR